MKRKMSRFVLRSNADQTKLSEQVEANSKSLTSNPLLKTPTKKSECKKSNNKNCTAVKNSILSSTRTTTANFQKSPPPKGKSSCEIDEQKHDGKISIICSLPLSRLSGIIEKLGKDKHNNNDAHSSSSSSSSLFTRPSKQTQQAQSAVDQCDRVKSVGGGGKVDRVVADVDDFEDKLSVFDDDTSNSKSQDHQDGTVVKTLCLYCEKQFNTQKMQQKHIEKFHSPQIDRRCSVRNSQVVASHSRSKSVNRQSSATNNRLTHNYPGCTFCKKLRITESTDPVRDFNGLFLHLTEQHADKYFGCKICILRFQNIGKLIKHMQTIHNKLPEAQLKLSKDFEIAEETRIESGAQPTSSPSPLCSSHVDKPLSSSSSKQRRPSNREPDSPVSNSLLDESNVIGSKDTILTRLGLTQNRHRMPSNRKGVRLRRDSAVPELLLKSGEGLISPGTGNTALTAASSLSKSRNNKVTTSKTANTTYGSDPDAAVFRVPARTSTDASATAFDENFYKDVTANVRNNLLFYLDGKLEVDTQNSHTTATATELEQQQHELLPSVATTTTTTNKSLPLLLKSTLVPTLALTTTQENLLESEIHVATNLPSTTAFPTLLTAEQYCGDVRKIRRPHTKHSWKWKWDSVKKYKLINEGGKVVKKAKHPLLGLRDLSKLDMWTQLSMRQKHEKQLIANQNASNFDDFPSGEKRRLNDQLNAILDTRVLPHIMLEQSEQAIIKLENDEFSFSLTTHDTNGTNDDNRYDFYSGNIAGGQRFGDESFLSLMHLLPRTAATNPDRKLVLSGEWARPRCYMCMCCGNRFEKLKSLEEHKTFRHSNIFSTHYEVVGRELLAGNLLQYLFIPKRALSYYSAPAAVISNSAAIGASAKKLMKYRRINIAAEEESSDSVQSASNAFAPAKHAFNLKSVAAATVTSTTDECDDTTDTKTTLIGGAEMHPIVSPSNSFQSSFSSSVLSVVAQSQNSLEKENTLTAAAARNWNCSKCSRKCNGISDLYRHMLDCSGDYIWSLAKKRKYRYYCGSKKRRQLHRQNSSELRKTNNRIEKTNSPSSKAQNIENCTTTEESSSNSYKPKTPPRPRPSDAESIKKMLENLPPKRVCKTIFPAVNNKVKKTRKPKFITKLYNTKILRKTRARQLAKNKRNASAARFAAKAKTAKNKIQNSLKCRNAKKQANAVDAVTNAASETSVTTTTDADSKADDSEQHIVNVSTNMEKKINSSPKSEESALKLQNEEATASSIAEISAKTLNCTLENSTTIHKENAQTAVDGHDHDEAKDDNKSPQSRAKLQSEMSVSTMALKQPESSPAAAAAQLAAGNSNGNGGVGVGDSGSACNRKRSKRISDCIAMLTGKLEEKLKTESTSISCSIAGASAESVETAECRIVAADAAAAAAVVTTSTSTPAAAPAATKEKKIPKRKTISRRIVKADLAADSVSDSFSNCSSVSALPAVVLENVETKPSTSTTAPPTASLIVATAIVTNVKTTKTTTTAATATAVTMARNKAAKICAEIKLPSPMPSVVPTMPTTLAPTSAKIMLPPPLATVTAAAAAATTPASLAAIPMVMPMPTALHALPVPLKVLQSHLPVYLPPPPPAPSASLNAAAMSTLQVPPVTAPAIITALSVPTNTTPTPSTAAVLPLPPLPLSLSNCHAAAAALLPAPLNLLPPQPQPQPQSQSQLLQAHIAPAAAASSTLPTIACPMEPLNLSSAKSSKKPTTAELRAQRPGMPARRQTICGFEARDLLTYNDMEPLDLSVKAKTKPSTNAALAAADTATARPTELNRTSYETVDLSFASKVANSKVEQAAEAPANNLVQSQLSSLPAIPLQMPVPVPVAVPSTPTLATLPVNSETIFNKTFYSNLELLKIPQIRAAGFLPPPPGMLTTVAPTADQMALPLQLPLPLPLASSTTSPNVNVNVNDIQTAQSTQPNLTEASLAQTPAQLPTPKVNNQKKRNNNNQNNKANNIPEPMQTNATATTTTSKKESNTKQKPITKMDEEVINHIDDAINSVINAVKASLYESEQQQQQKEQEEKQQQLLALNEKIDNAFLKNAAANQQQPAGSELEAEKSTKHQSATGHQQPAATTVNLAMEKTVTTTEDSTPPTVDDNNSKVGKEAASTPTNKSEAPMTTAVTDVESTLMLPTLVAEMPKLLVEEKKPIVVVNSTPVLTTIETMPQTSATVAVTVTATVTEPTTTTTPATTTTTTTTTKSAIALTPKKRNLRSKTLDCRTQLKETTASFSTTTTITTNRNELYCSPPQQAASKPQEKPNSITSSSEPQESEIQRDAKIENITQTTTVEQTPTEIATTAGAASNDDKIEKNKFERTNANQFGKKNEAIRKSKDEIKDDLKGQPKSTAATAPVIAVVTANTINAKTVGLAEDSSMNVSNVPAIATNTEENISNIVNNTSSGFHSSSTPENAAAVGVVKKKQRRRRKNELAAIVADQLLESFKIDKARRDSLKKLENLAYEKSDDLLITGMLLMSSTKRSASSAVCFNQNADKQRNAAENAKRQKQQQEQFANELIMARPKSRNSKVFKESTPPPPLPPPPPSFNKTEDSHAATAKLVAVAAKSGCSKNNTKQTNVEVVVANETVTPPLMPPRRGRGRPAGRKGNKSKMPLDNENLSKLKSSLESFSIGIEKQLSEFEARHSTAATTAAATSESKQTAKKNLHNKNENKSKKISNQLTATTTTTTVTKADPTTTTSKISPTNSYILRPSILAASLEQAQQTPATSTTPATCQMDAKETKNEKIKDKKATTNNQTNAIATTTAATVQGNSLNTFSRDPRLNKNIHKDETLKLRNSTTKNASTIGGQQDAADKINANASNAILDIEDDNYLTEIAKNVNEKIMAAENEEFAFAENDDFEIGTEFNDDDNDDDVDDDDDEYSRPPTSMSVRSAPNFNDDHSNFGSICDENTNTNTEVMDMDLDDEMSVYTSFSQDLGRGRGRKRRRRRSILLKRRPKKQRRSSQDLPAEKFECELCKKTFFAATSLAKHNMTLAHVSKVSEREYLMSKASGKAAIFNDHFTSRSLPKRQTRRKRAQSMNLELLERKAFLMDDDDVDDVDDVDNDNDKHKDKDRASESKPSTKPTPVITAAAAASASPAPQPNTTQTSQSQQRGQRLSLNPDERLFYECCNILKSADTTRTARNEQEAAFVPPPLTQMSTTTTTTGTASFEVNKALHEKHVHACKAAPPLTEFQQQKNAVLRPSSLQRVMLPTTAANTTNIERHAQSPTYSQFSAVTNTTQSRFKTKAAMKGYENGNVDITLHTTQEMRTRPACKLTELADIALGHDEKPMNVAAAAVAAQQTEQTKSVVIAHEHATTIAAVDRRKAGNGCRFATSTAAEPHQMLENNKKTMAAATAAETQGSTTSSKTIMHSSFIKAAVEEHNSKGQQATSKIIIPERPFKNIGLEEKAPITFQKPKTTALNLLVDDGIDNDDDDVNSVSTASYSDRDDFDFNSMSCDDDDDDDGDTSVKNSNEKNLKSNSSESSSSRATAKTFENKSLIMGRIFKNASTKAKATATANVTKSVAVPKDNTPKADLNQLFDELRGGDARQPAPVKPTNNDFMIPNAAKDFVASVQTAPTTKELIMPLAAKSHAFNENATTPKIAQDNKRKSSAGGGGGGRINEQVSTAKKSQSKQNKKVQRDLSQLKLQTELGMSQEDIEKLIDEGQRKSKRRCAANRSKKLVETWSSDEYEEFLSTKDIIALIEEKEKQEQRRKRKSSLGSVSGCDNNKEKSLPPTTTTSTMTIATTMTMTTTTTTTTNALGQGESMTIKKLTSAENAKLKEKQLKSSENAHSKIATASAVKEKENTRQSKPFAKKASTKSAKKSEAATLKHTTDECTNSSIATSSRRSNKPAKFVKRNVTEAAEVKKKVVNKKLLKNPAKKTSPTPTKRVEVRTATSAAAAEASGSESDDNLYLLDIKRNINNNNNSTCKKNRVAKKEKLAAKGATPRSFNEVNVSVNNLKPNKLERAERAAKVESEAIAKKGNAIAIGGCSSSSNKKNKGRGRKTQSGKSPIRKRKAAEKLYYWSSSSDEELGHVNEHAHEPEFENTEQYQKHGWIVGDSHKKLVTLLAIAKGNKKQVESCGVKKNNSQKKKLK